MAFEKEVRCLLCGKTATIIEDPRRHDTNPDEWIWFNGCRICRGCKNELAGRLTADQVRCEGCGLSYGLFPLDVIVPDEQWTAISGRDDGGGILCAACIVARGARLPGITVAKLVFE